MKNGRYIPLGDYKKIKLGYGTIDIKNLKSVYLKMNAWIEPLDDELDFNRLVMKINKKIKDYFYNKKIEFFKKEIIVDFDLRTKGIKLDKKSFMDLEITLFVDKVFDVKNNDIKKMIKENIITIIDTFMIDDNKYKFHKTKKGA